jgi:hypothetical protein
MENITYEDYLANPSEVLAQIQREASRARALAVHQYILMPLAQFCGRLLAIRGAKLYLDPRAATLAA